MATSPGKKVGISLGLAALLVAAILLLVNFLGQPPEDDLISSDPDEQAEVSSPETGSGLAGSQTGTQDEEEPGAAETETEPSEEEEPAPEEPEETGPIAIQGRVVDVSDEGIAGARLVAIETQRWNEFLESLQSEMQSMRDPTRAIPSLRAAFEKHAASLPSTESAEDGQYAFRELGPGEYRLLVTHPEYLQNLRTWVLHETADEPTEADIVLTEGFAIGGRIVDERGQPVEGATIHAIPSNTGGQKGLGKMIRFVTGLFDGSLAVDAGGATSSADGTFRLTSLEPVTYELTANANGFARGNASKVRAGTEGLTIELPAGTSVIGRVVDAEGEPLAAVRGSLSPFVDPQMMNNPMTMNQLDIDILGERTTTFETNTAGSFRASGLEAGVYTLELEPPVESLPRVDMRFDVANAVVDLGDIVMQAAEPIAGRVVDERGAGVVEATVWAHPVSEGGRSPFQPNFNEQTRLSESTTDDQGRFRLGGLTAGEYMIRVQSEEYAPGRAGPVMTGADNISIELERGGVVSGRFLDAETGDPIADVRVMIVNGQKEARSDEEGYFEARGISLSSSENNVPFSGSMTFIVAQHPDYQQFSGQVKPQRPDARGEVKEYRLNPLDRIYGFVVDPDGEPIRNARVVTRVEGIPEVFLMMGPGGRMGSSYTDEEGAFAIGAPAAQQFGGQMKPVLVATHPRFAPARVDLPEAGSEVQIVMTGGATLKGQIVSENGAPVSGAILRVKRTVKQNPQMMFITQMFPQKSGKAYYSDPDGNYAVPMLEPGSYDIEVVAMGYASEKLEGFTIGESDVVQNFVLDAGGTITGRIVDTVGEPLPGAEVVAVSLGALGEDSRGRNFEREMLLFTVQGVSQAKSAEDGTFALKNLPDGEFAVVARKRGHEAVVREGLRDGDDTGDIVLALRAILEGTVRDFATGQPITEFTVSAESLDEERRSGADLLTNFPRNFSDDRGYFVYEGVNPGRYRVTVQNENYVPASQEVALASGDLKTLQFRLVEGFALRGVVVEETSQLPIEGATLSYQPVRREGEAQNVTRFSSLNMNRATTDEAGLFAIKGLAEGEYHVSVSHPDFYVEGSSSQQIEVPADLETELAFKMRAAGRIEGRIDGVAGTDATQEWMNLRLELVEGEGGKSPEAESPEGETQPRRKVTQSAWVNPGDGSFNAASLKPGVYRATLIRNVRVQPSSVQENGGVTEPTQREVPLGEVEVVPGQTRVFNASVDR